MPSETPASHRTRIEISDADEYEWLVTVREDLGLTWRGLMLKAEQQLVATEQQLGLPSGRDQTDCTEDSP